MQDMQTSSVVYCQAPSVQHWLVRFATLP